MEKQSKIILMVILFALVVLCGGVTYAYFSSLTPSESSSTIVAKGGTMNVVYDNKSANISVTNVYPREEAWVTKKFQVIGNNTTDLKMYYRVSMVIDNNEFLGDDMQGLSYTLTGENTTNNGEIIPDVTTHTLILPKEGLEALSGNENQILGTGTFTKGENQVHTYTLKIFFDDNGYDQNDLQEAQFAAHLIIDSVNEEGYVVASNPLMILPKITNNTVITKTFKVMGNSDSEQGYSINLNILYYSVNGENLKYSLTSVNEGKDGVIASAIENSELDESSDVVSLGSGKLVSENSVHTYTLSFNGSENSEQALAANINILFSPKYFSEAKDNTLLANINKNINSMSTAKDDYGTSYYYTGNVENNFVSFAGMCWRIVRTTGNGAIKLTLYNYSSSDCTQTGDTLAFARYDGDTYKTPFNVEYTNQNLNTNKHKYNIMPLVMQGGLKDNAYVGFMYGTPGSDSYTATHANLNKSAILLALEKWYDLKLNSYDSKLADVIYCNDKSTFELGYNANLSYYGFYNRKLNGALSLICPNDNNGGSLSKFTVNDTVKGNGNLDKKIGLLTGDEALLSRENSKSYISYLTDNARKNYYTLSPASLNGIAYIPVLYDAGSGHLNYYDGSVLVEQALRPVIALNPDVTIKSGDGTSSNPFVVE